MGHNTTTRQSKQHTAQHPPTPHSLTSHSIFHPAASGHSPLLLPPPPPPCTAAAGMCTAGDTPKGVRCAMESRGPYSPFISTLLATLVRNRLAEKVCRQQRPLCRQPGRQTEKKQGQEKQEDRRGERGGGSGGGEESSRHQKDSPAVATVLWGRPA